VSNVAAPGVAAKATFHGNFGQDERSDRRYGRAHSRLGIMSSLAAGVQLDHRFTLRHPLGSGGMSQVWRAEDDVLGRPVAVKVLAAELAADPALSAATWTEARAAAQLAHPHVTRVYDYGQAVLPDGATLPYLVMELVDGQSLADRLAAGPLPWPEAVAVCAQVASALAAAHGIGVVHRDIKPGNVMLTQGGAKVLDFGIASLAGDHLGADGGHVVGTPGYAAPERLRPGPAVPASDVYALGVLLYETLTGHPPRPVSTWREAALAHQDAAPPQPPAVPGLPRAVRRLCLACLSPDPALRPTAEEAAKVLDAAAGRPPVVDTAPGRPPVPAATPAAAPTMSGPPAGFAVGSAPLPHPPTMVDYHDQAPVGDLPARTRGRPLVMGLVATVVVLALALTLVSLALLSRHPATDAGTGAGASPSSAVTGTVSPPASSAAPAPVPTATTADAIADALVAAITSAQASGQIDSDAAHSLLGNVNDLRDAHGGKRIRERAQQLQHTIGELVANGKLDQSVGAQLTTLLQPLVGEGDR
jgi:eukaryotic-like serine/threonine-protein kinase